MPDSPCRFFWYELMTSDTAAALDFYKAVVGWGTTTPPVPDMPEGAYTVLTVNGDYGVGGVMKMPEDACEKGGKPGWVGYILVPDVDNYVERVKAAGGSTFCAPQDIPNIGRFAVVGDPHGAVFMMMTPIGDAPCEKPDPWTPGMFSWRELHAGNGPEAWEFYSKMFGWTVEHDMDMNDLGVYRIFSTGDGMAGGMMTKMADCPVPFWLYYINVDDINAAVDRAKANGGQLLMGPHQVPTGSWIAQCTDPQGAMFALVSPPAAE